MTGVPIGMGSWYETCGISTLPIRDGERVRYIFLRQRIRERADEEPKHCVLPTTYTVDLWCPVSLPIRARYHDSGEIRGYTFGYAEKLFMEEIGRPATHAEFDKLLDEVRRGTGRHRPPVIYKPEHMHPCILSAVMVHERIYNAMARIKWLEYRPYDRISSRSTMKAAIRKLVEAIRKDSNEAKTKEERHRLTWKYGSSTDFRNPISAAFGGESGLQALDYLRVAFTHGIILPDSGFDESDPETAAFLDDFATLLTVDRSMGHMRKFWSPQTGKGSQDDDMVGYRVLGRAIERHIQADREKWHRENLGPAPWQRSKFVADMGDDEADDD